MDTRSLAAAAAGSTSIVITVLIRAGVLEVTPQRDTASTWLIGEPLLLAVLVFVVVRWAPPHAAVVSGSLSAAGSMLWVQRFLPHESTLDAAAASATWLLPSLAAGTLGWYLRWAAAERTRAVDEARTEQRLRLAMDLHDFVAHDISEIVARAQAGSAVLPLHDPRVVELLAQIEAAGLRALDSMDQTVQAWGEPDSLHSPDPLDPPDPRRPRPATRGGLDDIDELVRRFATAGQVSATVERQLSTQADGTVDGSVGAEAYRAVVEALTNVRRHADRATQVRVVLSEAQGCLRLSVIDDGRSTEAQTQPQSRSQHQRHSQSQSQSQPQSQPHTQRLGLTSMAARAATLGGHVEAGPQQPHGWRVTVTLPLSSPPRTGAPG